MALLRNLRNMQEAGVDRALVHGELVRGAKNSRALPFRFLAAARHAPQWEPMIDEAMQLAVAGLPKLQGCTDLLVDVSGSMTGRLSGKSELNRIEAACGLAILLRAVCEDVNVYTFASDLKTVPPRSGMALRDAIMSQFGGSTQLGLALNKLRVTRPATRTIVITDEQAHDTVGAPRGVGYMLDVAGMQHGVGFGQWHRISGFSEAVVNYIAAQEHQPLTDAAED